MQGQAVGVLLRRREVDHVLKVTLEVGLPQVALQVGHTYTTD